jgi:excisionase family DNA binding protein
MAADSSELLTVAEACRYLKVTRTTLYRWARLGKVRFVKLGERSTRLRRDDVARLAGLDGAADDQREARFGHEQEEDGWLKLAESSFAKDWDNEQDAIYDNWKELYGVRDR